MNFSGGNHLSSKDGLPFYIHQTMMRNELSGGIGAYQLSNAQNAQSGPVRAIQYDVGGNAQGRRLLEQICRSAKATSGARYINDTQLSQLPSCYKPFAQMSVAEKTWYQALKPQVDLALQSPIGVQLINQDYQRVLRDKSTWVAQVIAQSSVAYNKQFLQKSTVAQLLLIDIRNQYSDAVVTPLLGLLNQTGRDKGVVVPGGLIVRVQSTQGLSVQDLVNFRYATQYGQKYPQDVARRVSNIFNVCAYKGNTAATVSFERKIPANTATGVDAKRLTAATSETNENTQSPTLLTRLWQAAQRFFG